MSTLIWHQKEEIPRHQYFLLDAQIAVSLTAAKSKKGSEASFTELHTETIFVLVCSSVKLASLPFLLLAAVSETPSESLLRLIETRANRRSALNPPSYCLLNPSP